jgi:hypothetical protein
MKKGQLMGQPFVYIFLVLVAAFVLFFGIKSIINLVGFGKEVEYRNFVNELKEKESKVYHDSFESVLSLNDLVVPDFISEICFVNRGEEINLEAVKDSELREVIRISSSSARGDNVFFASDKLRAIELKNVRAESNPLCDRTYDRRIDLRFVNKGDYVLVEGLD